MELYHYGVFGMKWGVRRYQDENGTLTKEGRKRQRAAFRKERKEVSDALYETMKYKDPTLGENGH